MPSPLTPEDVEELRLAIYGNLSRTGRVPGTPGLARILDWDETRVNDALTDLHEHRDVVIDQQNNIVMAHPFSTVPLGFSVMGEETLWWGGCAWDSFAIPHLLRLDSSVLVATRCPACHTPCAWNVDRQQPPRGDEVAHFLTPAEHIWDDVVHSCAHQRIFCSDECVDAWLEQVRQPRGYVMDLTTLWKLSSDWYAGRLSRGYQRREPAAAAAYFAQVGLHGPFWGLAEQEGAPNPHE